MYQNGLVRVTPKADATGNRVGIAVIEAAVIPNPEEICPEMCPRILGPALMTATPCAFVGNAPEYSRVSSESNHIRLLRPPHKRVGCKISVLRRASPTVIAITKFIVVYHRQEPKLRAPNTFNLLKVIGIAWAPFSSYQLRQQLSGSVPY